MTYVSDSTDLDPDQPESGPTATPDVLFDPVRRPEALSPDDADPTRPANG